MRWEYGRALSANIAGSAHPAPYCLLSLGGMVAAAWSTRYPALLTLLLPTRHVVRQERLILRLTSANRVSRADVLAAWTAYAREYPVTRRNALCQFWAAVRYVAPADRPAPPTLVLASAGDRLVAPRCSLSLARAWHSALGVHADASHDVPLNGGRWVPHRCDGGLRIPARAMRLASPLVLTRITEEDRHKIGREPSAGA